MDTIEFLIGLFIIISILSVIAFDPFHTQENVEKCFPDYDSAKIYTMKLQDKCMDSIGLHGTPVYKFVFTDDKHSVLYVEYDYYSGPTNYTNWKVNETHNVTIDKYNHILNVE